MGCDLEGSSEQEIGHPRWNTLMLVLNVLVPEVSQKGKLDNLLGVSM